MANKRALERKHWGEFRQWVLAGNKIKECCDAFGISEATGYRILKIMRESGMPHVVRNRKQYARWQLTARNSQHVDS